ncbi:hypothetical protein PBAL39_25630 [Pedobacter sp. BAL39]|uniref:DUF551 domain-containing protein n=1 Tax=Pedobacter sp. BAL39 TaxID=391596 RepID=UPI000155972D|nr:DUF551 domain-containing protein [Pedobacter sp. BAL39]EDM36712.1 hypothetical protein PBAL39_25630 [Pedobacter sp. BAL39]
MKEWIATTEKMPEDLHYKLVTVVNPELEYGYQVARFNLHLQEWELQEEESLSACLKVSAWMDLPDLYRN